MSRKPIIWNREVLAYLIGIGLGDGSLSKPNGRSVCLRIACDTNYPKLIQKIIRALNFVLPESKVNIVKTPKRCVILTSHSNYWEGILEWKVGHGSKFAQDVKVPDWIWSQDRYIKACLEGLLETDGSVYYDRGYPMVMFVNIAPRLAYNVAEMMNWLGFEPRVYNFIPRTKYKSQRLYHVRLSKNVKEFLKIVQPLKA